MLSVVSKLGLRLSRRRLPKCVYTVTKSSLASCSARYLSTLPHAKEVFTDNDAGFGSSSASGTEGTGSSSASKELKDSEELATFLVHSLGTEKDIKALCRNISTMRTNPSTKMLTLSRMALKTPPHCRWVCNWLWPILNGMKPLEESFPVSIPESIINAGSFDNHAEVMVDSLDKIDAMLKSEDPNNVRRPISAATLTSHQITDNLAKNVPYMVFENVAKSLEGIASGESDSTTVEKALRQSTIMHTEHMVDVYHFTGLGHGGYLNRYLRTSKTKKKKILAELNSELCQLFSGLQEDQQRESEFETAVEDGSVGERWQEISKFEQEKQRQREVTRGRDKRLGRKNTLYTYIRAERSEDSDFGIDEWTHKHVQGRHYFDPREDSDGDRSEEEEQSYAEDADVDDLAAEIGINTTATADANADDDGEEGLSFLEDSSLPINKVFVGNLPRNVNGADVANALRNCGEVAKVWFYNTDAGVSSGSAEAKETKSGTGAGGDAEPIADGNVGKLDLSNVSIEEVHNNDGAAGSGVDGEHPMAKGQPPSPLSSALEFEVGELEMDEDGSGAAILGQNQEQGDDDDLEEDPQSAFSAFLVGEDDEDSMNDMAGNSSSRLKVDAPGFPVEIDGVEADRTALSSVASDIEEPDLRVAVAHVRRLEDEEEEFKRKTKTLKKRLMRMQRGYNYAYVQMMDEKGYFNATRDEMRVFGVCINGYNCRVQEALRLRTLVVEVLVPLRCSEIKHTLTANLGSWYNFDYYKGRADVKPEEKLEMDRSKPIFVHLEFGSHEEAWKSFELLDSAFREGRSDLKVSWVKSEWYWTVAKKARELSFTTSPKTAKSLEKEIEELSVGKQGQGEE